MHTFNSDPNVAKLQKYTIDLYKEIEQFSGQSLRRAHHRRADARGAPRRASTGSRCRAAAAISASISLPSRPREAAELMPLIDEAVHRRVCTARTAMSTPTASRKPTPSRRARPARTSIASPGRGHRAAARRRLARRHRQRRDRLRARRQCRRPMGARSRPHGRHRAAGARHGAHVHRHRRHSRGRRVDRVRQGDLPRHRLRGEIYMRQEGEGC